MATFLDLRNRVSRILMDVPTNTATEIPLLVNEAMTALQSKHNFFVMQASASYTTVAATRQLGAVPTDWKEYRNRPYYTEELGGSRWITVASSRGQAENYRSNLDEDSPEVLLKVEETTTGTGFFDIYPLPDGNSDYADGEYRITVPYWKFLAPLAADGDTNWFLQQDDAIRFIVAEAAADGFEFNEDDNRADRWHKKALDKLHSILLLDKYKWLSMNDTLVPHHGARSAMLTR